MKHVELEQFLHASASHRFVSDSCWAFLFRSCEVKIRCTSVGWEVM